MKFWLFLAFLAAVVSAGWWTKAVERMTNSNPTYDPNIADYGQTTVGGIPTYDAETYLIDGSIRTRLPSTIPVDSNPYGGVPTMSHIDPWKREGAPMMLDKNRAPMVWEQDDGTVSSDTATRNPMLNHIYSYNPLLQVSFPVSGPPQPYLTDFSKLLS